MLGFRSRRVFIAVEPFLFNYTVANYKWLGDEYKKR